MKDIAMKNVAVKDITVGENFRKSMDKNALKELTESIKKVGVIEPLILRKSGDTLVLIAGARRLAAAQEAGLKEVKCSIVEVDDDGARLMQAMENIHRENLNPIDEAEQFDKLLKENQQAKDLVEVVGKSLRYIYRSLALLDLPKDIQEMIRVGKMRPAHGHLLLRVPEKRLKVVMDYYKSQVNGDGECSVNRLQREIDKMLGRDMSEAIFAKDDCAKCPHYTKNQSMLFDVSNTGLCDDAMCFKKKTNEHRKMLAEQAGKSKNFKDLKFLGIKGGGYSYETKHYHIGKHVVVDEAIQKMPAFKKEYEKSRENFGYSLNPTTNKPQLVIINEDFIKKLKLDKDTTAQQGAQRDYDKERFINEAESKARIDAYAKADVKSEKVQKALVKIYITERVDEDGAAELLGIKEIKKDTWSNLTSVDLLKILCLDIIDNDDVAKVLPEVNKAAVEAVKAAEAAWPEEKKRRDAEQAAKDQDAAVKAVEARKAGKATKPKPEEAGGDDDGEGEQE